MNIKEFLKKKRKRKHFNYLLITFISFVLSSCNEDNKAQTATSSLPVAAQSSASQVNDTSNSNQNGLLSHLASGVAGGVAAGAASAATSHAIQSFKDKRERKKGLISANRFRQRRRVS